MIRKGERGIQRGCNKDKKVTLPRGKKAAREIGNKNGQADEQNAKQESEERHMKNGVRSKSKPTKGESKKEERNNKIINRNS